MNSQKSISLMLSLIVCFSYILIPKRVEAIPVRTLEQNHNTNIDFLSIRDRWTQYFFDLIRPELININLKDSDLLYHREKAAISEIVTYVLDYTCHQVNQNEYYILTQKTNSNLSDKYPRYRYYPRGINRTLYNRARRSEWNEGAQQESRLDANEIEETNFFWQLNRDYFFHGLYQDLTDAVFYARHPEISHKENKLQYLNWSAEWNFIRRRFVIYNQEKIFKNGFIPVCQNNSN